LSSQSHIALNGRLAHPDPIHDRLVKKYVGTRQEARRVVNRIAGFDVDGAAVMWAYYWEKKI
jgi:hypothetical protein